jgi:hypothetical protein
MMKKNNWLMHITAAAAGCLFIAATGQAQEMGKGQVETTAQAGIVAGIGTRASLGGSLGAAVNDRVFAFGEFGWVPLGGSSTSGTTPGGSFEFASSGRIVTFMVGAHYQFRGSRSFVPYAGAALGAVHGSGSFTSTVGGSTTETSFSNGDLYLSFGGGWRYYVNNRWGFKPEMMIFAGDDTFVRIAGGIFYQFGR